MHADVDLTSIREVDTSTAIVPDCRKEQDIVELSQRLDDGIRKWVYSVVSSPVVDEVRNARTSLFQNVMLTATSQ